MAQVGQRIKQKSMHKKRKLERAEGRETQESEREKKNQQERRFTP
jgi:hypothetical protein